MRFKILSLLAALVMVSACASEPEDSAASSGAGASTSTSTTGGSTGTTSGGVNDVVAGSERDFIINVGDRVFFGYDRSDLSADAQSTLSKQAAWLLQFPNVSIQVEGHADERGTREYNLALGERRANSVKEYMISLGVAAGRLSTISYGKERPAVEGSNEESWAQNRRGVTRIASGATS